MTLEAFYYISQIIAVVAIVGSLVFVGIQIKQQRDDARLASIRDVHKEWRDLMRYLIENPEMNELMWFKARADGLAALTPDEALRVSQNADIFINYWQEVYHRHKQGRLDDGHFKAVEQKLAGIVDAKGGAELWQIHKVSVTDDFRDYVDNVLEKLATTELNEHQLARDKILVESGLERADAPYRNETRMPGVVTDNNTSNEDRNA